jgi:hypothetical protein
MYIVHGYNFDIIGAGQSKWVIEGALHPKKKVRKGKGKQ